MRRNNDISIDEFKEKLKNIEIRKYPKIETFKSWMLVGFIVWFVVTLFIFRDTLHLHLDGKLGDLGGYIGGTLGTIAAIAGVWYVYKTYISQKIEGRFFELLKLHQEDVDLIYRKEGARAFESYISITRSFADRIDKYCKSKGINIENEYILQLAYLCMFYGVEKKEDVIKPIREGIQNSILNDKEVEELLKELCSANFTYKGAYLTIGTYFRQLYQTLKFINNQDQMDLLVSEKYEYGKMLRVRLSVDEQYLLFLNSLVKLGEVWDDQHEGLISKYNMLTNIPPIYPFILDLNVNEIYDKVEYENESMNKTTTEKNKNTGFL